MLGAVWLSYNVTRCPVQPNFPSLYLRHSSFSNPSVALPTSQLILQPFRCFTYVTSSFSKLSVTLPTSQLILQPFPRFTYVTAHSLSFQSLYLRHSSFSNPSLALPTSQLLLQPFRCFTYVTAHSPTLLSLLLCHRIFTCVTWRAAHGSNCLIN